MRLNYRNNFLGYFRFYYSILGNKLIFSLCLGILVSFLDGIGLSLFMPLLQTFSDKPAPQGKEEMGQLHYITDGLVAMGLDLTLNTVLIILVLLFTFKGIIKFIQLNSQVVLWNLFMRKIRFQLLSNLQNLSFTSFLKLDAGKIHNTLTTETQRLSFSIRFYFNAAQSCIMLLSYVILAFLANYQFAILVGIGAGLSNLLYRRLYVSVKTSSVNVSQKASEFNGLLTQAVHSFKYLKSTNFFSGFSIHLKKVIRESEDLSKKMGFNSAITSAAKEPMILVIVVAVIYLQVNFMGTAVSSILLSLLLLYRALSFLLVIQNNWQNFIQNIGAISAVTSLMNEMYDGKEINIDSKFKSLNENLHIKDAGFSYGVGKVLNKINIIVPKNNAIAIIGESGSGKTTLANLIAGLIQPTEGDILIDGVSLRNLNIENYRSKIGYISQEAVIFTDDIYNNITFWAERTPENLNRFWETVELASLSDFIERQPEKEFTKLGDNGILISGGQKQRISIARELFKDIELLILDEATSALDSETEKIIQDNIEKLHGRYTMVIIAHRLSTIKKVDTIYLLEHGNVISSGTFDYMLEISERFKRMVSLQEV